MKLRRSLTSSAGGFVVIAGLASCARPETPPPPEPAPAVVNELAARAPTKPRKPMRPLAPAKDAHPSPETTEAFAPNTSVDARVLVITADGTDSAFDAISSALGFLGTPYDVLNATTGPMLTDAMLANGDHGKYQAVFLDLGDLTVGGTSAFSDAEWMALASYEARFGVRRVALYASPTADYGLRAAAEVDPSKNPIGANCTTAGAAVFVGANCGAPVTIDVGWAYPATATDAQTTPLLVDGAGRALAATRTYPDGREALALTFAQSPYAEHTLELGYGLVNWATRGLFIGERHTYLSAQLDDFFLASVIYPRTGTMYRCTAADLDALAAWQSARRANPLVAGVRLAWAVNAQGAHATDPLTMRAMALGPTFSWISHTWDHADLTVMNYPDALIEFSRNDDTIRALGLQPYATENAVTPGISGLDNPNAMLAAAAAGIRQLVSDTSEAGEGNPSPNAGFCNALVPSILEIPRIPTNLFFDVSQPDEWTAEYAVLVGKSATYDQIIDTESRRLAAYMLAGNVDPWMFHQANIRDLGGGHSLVTDLLGATLDRYLGAATFPVLSPTMDETAKIMLGRMAFNASGVSGTISNGTQLTLQTLSGARIPVTGLCTKDAERYGGQTISHVDVAPGAPVTFTLGDCSAVGSMGAGPPGNGIGCGDAGAAGGGGTGSGGTTGSGGATGSAGSSAMGAGGSTGSSGSGPSSGSSGSGGTSAPTGLGGSAADPTGLAGDSSGDPNPPGDGIAGDSVGSDGPSSDGGSGATVARRNHDGCAVSDPSPSPLALAITALGGLVLGIRRRPGGPGASNQRRRRGPAAAPPG